MICINNPMPAVVYEEQAVVYSTSDCTMDSIQRDESDSTCSYNRSNSTGSYDECNNREEGLLPYKKRKERSDFPPKGYLKELFIDAKRRNNKGCSQAHIKVRRNKTVVR